MSPAPMWWYLAEPTPSENARVTSPQSWVGSDADRSGTSSERKAMSNAEISEDDPGPRRSLAGMQSARLVELLVARDPNGMAALYDAYAPRLYNYCAWLVGDRDSAGDVLHDSLIIAAGSAGQLRDPSRLKPWLYAIARNECRRLLRQRQRHAELPPADLLSDDAVDLDAGVRAEQAKALIASAVASLNSREREVIDLALRHDMSASEIGAALAITPNHAHALLSRAKAQLEKAVTAVVLARTGQQDCSALARIVGDAAMTPILRKRVNRHIAECATCGETKRRQLAPAAMFAGLPILLLPTQLRDDVLARYSDRNLVSYRVALAERAEPFAADGFPVPLSVGPRRGVATLAGVGVVLVVALIGAVVWRAGADEPRDLASRGERATEIPHRSLKPGGPTESSGPSVAAAEPSKESTAAAKSAMPAVPLLPPAAAKQKRAPAASGAPNGATPSPTEINTPLITTEPPGTIPQVKLVVTDATKECGVWSARITVTVTGNVAAAVTVSWSGSSQGSVELSPSDNGRWTGSVAELSPGSFTWRATARTANGLTGSSDPVPTEHASCPAIE